MHTHIHRYIQCRSLDFAVARFSMNLFRTVNMDVINE